MMHTTRFDNVSACVGRRALGGIPRWCWALALVVPMAGAAVGEAQEKRAPKSDKEEIPPPIELKGQDLLTRDGVMLKATFYPGTKGKDTVPLILLHSSKGDRKEYAALAPFLQQRGHAVLVPDLRGFGESTQMVVGGQIRDFDAGRRTPNDYKTLVTQDMETLKGFLVRQNDEGLLNVNKLGVIGAEMGASVALHWARLDWSWPMLTNLKQGQDVKALVLISPQWSFPGLPVHEALGHPVLRSQLSMLILVGKGDQSAVSDLRRLQRMVKRDEDGLAVDKKTLFFGELDTKLQGARLLDIKTLNLEALIAQFIELRLVRQPDPWVQRRQ